MLSTVGMGTLAFLGATEGNETIPTTIWLFLQSLCLDIAYLSFQTIFFVYMIHVRNRKQGPLPEKVEEAEIEKTEKENNIYLTTTAI